MAEKSYLKNQIRLISLNASDLFTDEEHNLFMEICSLINEIDRLEKDPDQVIHKKELIAEKKRKTATLATIIKKHAGTPRSVRLKSVLSQNKDQPPEAGATWKRMKFSKTINEFASEMSRAMGLNHLDHTFDKIVVKWKEPPDLFEQLCIDGFTFDLLEKDGSITRKKYRLFTASSGQMRTDKASFISEDIWEKIKGRIECGMTWDRINEKSGINCNKLLPYLALASSATDPWEDFDIDHAIVIPDWEAEVTARMMYIKPDYTTEVGVRTVMIDHTDGAGMIDPKISRKNFMVRGPYCKGLLCSFDFRRFCLVHGAEPVIQDAWGQTHDLEAEDITVIFTTSQMKLWKYYDSWDHYKNEVKKNKCGFAKTNYEEDYIPFKDYNYQMLQTLQDFTDEEIAAFTKKEHDKLLKIAENKASMLQTLGANSTSFDAFKQALVIYPELLRDGHARKQLKDIKKRMLYDAKSGAIRCFNKRLFAIPDWYAACEHYFLHKERPDGLLKNGEIACKQFRDYDKADVLRSPHLFMEHAIRNISHDPNVYEWFYTDGVYTSSKDIISRILQFDVDGDELNVVVDPIIVSVAERNIKEYDIVPLFYDADKAKPEMISKEVMFNGLMRAHKFSNIGEISNMLTRLWNRNNPDLTAAALLTYLNNLRIDGAKNGTVNEYEDHPEAKKRINAATGGPHGRMPHFFMYSKNGRSSGKEKEKYAKPTKSTMNRICAAFDDIGNINMNYAGIPPFNYQMLMSEPFYEKNQDIVQTFCDLDGMSRSVEIALAEIPPHERSSLGMYEMEAEIIIETMTEKFGSVERCYPYIVKYLFSGDNWKKPTHKKMFWRVFGEIAVENLKNNLQHYYICPDCGAKVPDWAKSHDCPKNDQGFFVCVDCGKQCERTGSRQVRCDECQRNHRDETKKLSAMKSRERRKEYDEKCIGILRSFLTPTLETGPFGRRLSFVKVGQPTNEDPAGE